MKFSRLVLMASLILSHTAFSQTVAPMGGAPEGLLFRGMDNVIQITDNTGENRVFNIEFNGGIIETIEANNEKSSQGRYVLHATTANLNPELIVRDKDGAELNRTTFKVQRMPESDIKFATENGNYTKNVRQLVISNPFPYFQRLQEIVSWKIRIDGIVVVEDKGSRLNEMAAHQLSKLATGSSFELEVFLLDQEGIGRIIKTNFTTN